MSIRPIAPLALILVASCAAATPATPALSGDAASRDVRAKRMQFAFYNFDDDRVKVTVNGRAAFDRRITVAPDNARLGLAAVAQIDLPACADIVVTTERQRVAQRLCLTPDTKSIVVDAGPPLTIAPKNKYQGVD